MHIQSLIVLLSLPVLAWAGVKSIDTPMAPLVPGSKMTLNWSFDETPWTSPVAGLELVSRDKGSVTFIDKQISPATGHYTWNIPAETAEGTYYVRLTGQGNPRFTGDFHINDKDGTVHAKSDGSGASPGTAGAATSGGPSTLIAQGMALTSMSGAVAMALGAFFL
ncbi:hypothetical protein BJ684DRAFT_17649 [Piptocephalis cylindrospora]|uniref:Ser-Thr-rich glycosyl-phosphatidyl-inositol-anchored membrane family-domain-containing protein n=1 Tax=Piptocephalis cylindrospora TaxID=1907219 RepID=A0A4P9XZD5_9FUNG|nr:hypothetical protein BJ684DRAFT_17649 [Piptocephalis cylindrospora]|eukprot:RKP11795.1 hypothetical protein BJ684DRAFT_17649 [Piptocephalis cylindrospora]